MIVACLLALAWQAPSRVGLAEVEFTGPCATLRAELSSGAGFEVHFDPPLSAGERRTFVIAVPRPAEGTPQALFESELAAALEAPADGSPARFLATRPPSPSFDGRELPVELASRPRPLLEDGAPRGAHWASLFVAAAAFAMILGRRRRPVWTTIFALAAVGSIVVVERSARLAAPPGLIVFEAHGPADPDALWLRVRAARDVLTGVDVERASVEVRPASAALRCVTRAPDGRFDLAAPGATLCEISRLSPGPRRITREINALADLADAWIREPDGAWRRLGAWPFGQAMPAGEPGDPPGMLVELLPMGSSVLLGQVARPEDLRSPRDEESPLAGPGGAARPLPRTYLRWVGF